MTRKKTATSERYELPVIRFRDKDDNPTCAANFSTGEVCMFYGTQRMGSNETCWFEISCGHGKFGRPLLRRKQGKGTLIPLAECPIWHPTTE